MALRFIIMSQDNNLNELEHIYLAKSNDTFLWSHTAPLNHDEVIINLTIMNETSHGSDGFVCQIVLGGGIVLNDLKYEEK